MDTCLGPTPPQRPLRPQVLRTRRCTRHTGFTWMRREPVLFRRVIIQPLREAQVGPLCPLRVETQSERVATPLSHPVGRSWVRRVLWDSRARVIPDTGPRGGQHSPWCTFPAPGGLSGLSMKGGSAKEMGPLSKNLYEHKLLASLLFKGLILDAAGFIDEKVRSGSGNLPAESFTAKTQIHDFSWQEGQNLLVS